MIQAYRFSLDSFQILNTRSGNIFSTSKDTDYVSFALTVNNGQPQVITQSMGDLSNGTYSTNLTFDKVNIADSDNVVLTYHIINSSVEKRTQPLIFRNRLSHYRMLRSRHSRLPLLRSSVRPLELRSEQRSRFAHR